MLKQLLENKMLCWALVISIAFHVLLIATRFFSPKAFDLKKQMTSFELVLEENIQKESWSSVTQEVETVVQETARRQGIVATPKVSTTRAVTPAPAATTSDQSASQGTTQSGNATENAQSELKAAPGAKKGQDKIVRTVVTAMTKDIGYSLYYKSLRKRVEHMGQINFPQKNGRRLYGELTVRIPVAQNGSIYEGEGGPGIERSSGNRDLDLAALNIVRRAAPFGPLPKSKRAKDGRVDVWIVITRLKFTREQGY